MLFDSYSHKCCQRNTAGSAFYETDYYRFILLHIYSLSSLHLSTFIVHQSGLFHILKQSTKLWSSSDNFSSPHPQLFIFSTIKTSQSDLSPNTTLTFSMHAQILADLKFCVDWSLIHILSDYDCLSPIQHRLIIDSSQARSIGWTVPAYHSICVCQSPEPQWCHAVPPWWLLRWPLVAFLPWWPLRWPGSPLVAGDGSWWPPVGLAADGSWWVSCKSPIRVTAPDATRPHTRQPRTLVHFQTWITLDKNLQILNVVL